jgi:hypothetical protein
VLCEIITQLFFRLPRSIPAARSKVQFAALYWKDGAVITSNSVN